MPKVYVVNKVDDDISKAAQFGEFEFINYRYVYGDELNDDCMPHLVESKIVQAARTFDPVVDYVMIAGDHLQLVAFVAALGKRYSRFRVLRWDRKAGGYLVVWVGPETIAS